MGRKHHRKGQYLYVCTACLIYFFLIFGCATLEGIKNRHIANQHIVKSQMLLSVGDYEGALNENRKILSIIDEGYPRDEAMFNIALIYAHYDNYQKDISKSLEYFKDLIRDYPDSPLSERARIWVGVLSDIEKTEMELQKRKNERVTSNLHLLRGRKLLKEGDYIGSLKENQKIVELNDKSPYRDRALFNMGLIYAHYDNPDKDYERSLNYFGQLIEEYPGSPLAVEARIWQSVLNIIKKTIQVDIEIEEKKKEIGR